MSFLRFLKFPVIAIAGLICLAVAIALLTFPGRYSDPRTPKISVIENDLKSVSERRLATVANRIRDESSSFQVPPKHLSAPVPPSSVGALSSNEIPIAPPDGYSIVVHNGQMELARLDDSYGDELEDETALPSWMDSSNAIDSIVELATHADRGWSFGWILLSEGSRTTDLLRDLEMLGGEFLGSTGRLVRAKLPGDVDRLQSLLSLKTVESLGTVPKRLKFLDEFELGPAHSQHSVFITLMSYDPDGRWRRVLEGMGAVVGHFDVDTRSYSANVSNVVLNDILEADFVLSVEPVRVIKGVHDTAVPATGADALRLYRAPGMFYLGGASVPVGVMDSGLNLNHPDISSNRRSICGANFVSVNRGAEDLDLWIDQLGHGTHVTGTLIGNGFIHAQLAGVAPSVKDIRFAKALDQSNAGDTLSVVRAMDFLATRTNCNTRGQSGAPIRPAIVNASLGFGSLAFTGREVEQRKLDAVVWRHSQLYVVSQGNSGTFAFTNTSAAKNSLAVGAVRDGGALASFSSHGPTADGRLSPQIVAPGVSIRSPAGGGSRADYTDASGTSSAAPAVAGIAVLLMDSEPAFRNQPALARARLMSSAISPDPWHDTVDRFPANNTEGPGDLQVMYGLGKASARTSVLDRSQSDGWTNGSATAELKNGEYAFQNIVIPEGASRLQLVLTWDEPPSDTISSPVLNDLDLWLDRFGDCASVACGEYASLSRKDNVEWIFLRDPPAGVYRAKVVPRRIYSAAPRSALAWKVIHGASTPTLRMEVDKEWLSEGRNKVRLVLSSDAYVAAGVRLRVACRRLDASSCSELRIHDVEVSREDDTSRSESEWSIGTHLTLGEVSAGERQIVDFLIDVNHKHSRDNAMRLYFTATGWNAKGAVVTLGAGDSEVSFPKVRAPRNDDFAHAIVIEGNEGSVDLDLVSATTEAGEPILDIDFFDLDSSAGSGNASENTRAPPNLPPQGRPAQSVWYRWTAPADGHFRIYSGSRFRGEEPIYVDVYTGRDIASLVRVNTKVREAFFAEQDGIYRIRVSNATHGALDFGRSSPITLNWSTIERPANDEFELGSVLEGAEGRFNGTNQGATLQPGEWFGGYASTVWHRWTSPQDGTVRFDTSSSDVMAFTGDDVTNLRLVSHDPHDKAVFSVRNGEIYRIAIASRSAFAAAAPYELEWRFVSRRVSNDYFAEATSIGGEVSSSHVVGIDEESTVEPYEPPETGVRSKWWVWQAPNTATYTWRIDDVSFSPLRISAFSGATLQNLQSEGSTGSTVGSREFTLSSVKNRRYWFSAGLPSDDVSVFTTEGKMSAPLSWGPTPPNNTLMEAMPIYGLTGSVSSSNAFATIGSGDLGSHLGHSSLWWSFKPAETIWYRFYLEDTSMPYALAVYEVLDDGSLELVSSSHWSGSHSTNQRINTIGIGQGMPKVSDSTEVIYRGNAGRRYVLRLGSLNDGPGGEFTLRWEETIPPVWFRFLGHIKSGDRGLNGTSIGPDQLSMLHGLATDVNGTLFAAASKGLLRFEHDLSSNSLLLSQTLTKDWSSRPRLLLHDPHRHRLYAHGCLAWDVFELSDSRLSDEGRDDIGAAVCGDGTSFMDSNSSSIYVVELYNRLYVFDFDAQGGLLRRQSIEIPWITDAMISNDDAHVYVVTNGSLVAFERDGGSGLLTRTSSQALSQRFVDAVHSGVAISHDDTYLFVFSDSFSDNEIVTFDVSANPARPVALHTLPLVEAPLNPTKLGCRFAGARSGTPGIGLFCERSIFGLQWRAATQQLIFTDVVRRVDRFNNAIPSFDLPQQLAVSPNGKYAYLATLDSGILSFERVGNSFATD